MDAADILSMPDSWEYPWFAAWDLAFHAVTLAHIDPAFAKYQLLLLCREWFQHPSGALPAYEWSFDDVNPPVHAWAALHVFQIDGARDIDFLERMFHKLLINYTWWLNREDADGNDLFGGGFLGLDNIGRLRPLARARGRAARAVRRDRLDGVLPFDASDRLRRSRTDDPTYQDLLITFLEHGVRITGAMDNSGMWDDEAGFFFDALRLPDGTTMPMRIHSMVGLIPLLPAALVRGGPPSRARLCASTSPAS